MTPPTAAGAGAPAGVVLAAGAGSRLRPLTLVRPKPLVPVGGRLLVDHALDRLEPHTGAGPAHLAVNAHHLADQVLAHCRGRAHVNVEPVMLGTAGALGALRGWLDGRGVLLTNADAYLPDGLRPLVDGWDGQRCRLLCTRVDVAAGQRADFGDLRYVGACLLPAAAVGRLEPVPGGLYALLWDPAWRAGELDLAVLGPDRSGRPAVALDCGTPAEYLAADADAWRRRRART